MSTATGVSAVLAFAALASAAQAAPMGADDARHLLNRAGFGASPSEVAEYAQLSREQATDRLLKGALAEARTPPPQWINEPIIPPRVLRDLPEQERKAFQAEQIRKGLELRAWWLTEMLATPSQLTERMTLFWHNHFVSSQQKVRYGQLMYRQNALLRRHALGNFGHMLHAVAKDPAMVIYLDSATNRKGKPNENFAREAMELFTLGEGHYSEVDIRESARAFTGWSIEPETGAFKWRPFAHDDGVKTVLGRRGNFDGDAVLDILLAQPATAEFVTAKLWREFVSPEPDPREVKRLAARFRDSGYDVRSGLRALILSDAFWAPENRAVLVKSPVDLVVGTMRSFELSFGDSLPFALVTGALGQNLFAPPNVRGWPGGTAWINSQTLLARKQFADRLFRADEMPKVAENALQKMAGDRDLLATKGVGRMGERGRAQAMRALYEIQFDPDRWLADFPGAPTQADIRRFVLAREPVNTSAADLSTRELVRMLTLDPVYQLK